MSEAKDSVFSTLSKVDVKPYIKEKEDKAYMRYLPWAKAWQLLKQHYPDAKRVVHDYNGLNYFEDGATAYVRVTVQVEGHDETIDMPVMHQERRSAIKALPLEQLTSLHVNNAIQRATVKAIAMHGLGIELWLKEDEVEIVTTKNSSRPNSRRRKEQGGKQPSQEPQSNSEGSNTIELVKGSKNWENVEAYILENYHLGAEVIGKQLLRKYSISKELKKEIVIVVNNLIEESKSK
jgi:hypothetical protein